MPDSLPCPNCATPVPGSLDLTYLERIFTCPGCGGRLELKGDCDLAGRWELWLEEDE